MWNVKRAKTNNAKAKNDSEDRDQSEENMENAEKTLNAYEHALACGNGARSFLFFFCSLFPLSFGVVSFGVVLFFFRCSSLLFSSRELFRELRTRRSRAFVARLPSSAAAECFLRTREEGRSVVHVLSSFFFVYFFALSLSLFSKNTGDGSLFRSKKFIR